jgi:hypothetical protein
MTALAQSSISLRNAISRVANSWHDSVVSQYLLCNFKGFQIEPGPSYEAGDSTCSAHDFPLEGSGKVLTSRDFAGSAGLSLD